MRSTGFNNSSGRADELLSKYKKFFDNLDWELGKSVVKHQIIRSEFEYEENYVNYNGYW